MIALSLRSVLTNNGKRMDASAGEDEEEENRLRSHSKCHQTPSKRKDFALDLQHIIPEFT